MTGIVVYRNLTRGKLKNRSIEIIRQDKDSVVIMFRNLVDLEKSDYTTFLNTATHFLIKREHSKWGILCTRILISNEATNLLHQMIEDSRDLEIYKPKKSN